MVPRHDTFAAVEERRTLERRLRGAIDAGDLRLEFQPVVELPSGRVTGVEALARWDDEVLGAVPPDRFIPLAESTGLILDLGRWALRAACRQAAQWQLDARRASRWNGAGSPRVAVNVSPLQLAEPSFIDDVIDALAMSSLPPDRLCLEVTETAAVIDLDDTADCLGQLRALGVCLALDDFGIGYSSLTMLRRLPVHTVKIDRSFTQRLTDSVQDAILIRLVIDAAHSLGMEVCAEGVEQGDQARHLVAMGCDSAQGWHFGRPKPPGADLAASFTPLSSGAPDAVDMTGAAPPLLTQSDELVLVSSPDGVIVYASSTSAALLGWTPKELVGTRVEAHLCPGQRIGSGAPETGAAGDESVLRFRHRDGADRWMRTTTRTLDRAGPRSERLSVCRDVTAEMRAEEALAESEERFRHAFDDAPIGMALTGLDGRFLRVNTAFADMLGTTAAALLGRCVADVTHVDDRDTDAQNVAELRTGDASFHRVTKRYVDVQGRTVPAVVHAAVVNNRNGEPAYVIAHVLSQ